LTINLPFNDSAAARSAVDRYGDEIACVIVEPVAGNMGVVPPRPGFLEALRKITESRGIVLIFDEVITGFRLTYGGYQNLIGIEPDLTCLGKIIGGGLPVGAFGGKKKIMKMLAPLGPVYQAGTLSGNPLAMAAGLATLKLLRDDRALYDRIDGMAVTLCGELKRLFAEKGLPAFLHRAGSMFTAFFTGSEVFDFATASTSDTKLFARFFRGMLSRGVYLAPSQFEAAFISNAHGHDDIDRTLSACAETLRGL
jgi:glutamate-1-semialdehyde 2,1-aminomutase